MGEYRLTGDAYNDLEEILHFTIGAFGEAQAERYKAVLEAGLQRVATDSRLSTKVE